jgi:hypothetical protein
MMLRLRSSFSPVFRRRCLLAATTTTADASAVASRCTAAGGFGGGDYSSRLPNPQQQTPQRRGMAFQKSFVSFF